MGNLLFWIKTSRPGLWFPTIWLYLLPLGTSQFWESGWFWAGLLFVTFPLNFMIYGWNDIVDYETDRLNPRKDTFLFGAKGNKNELSGLPLPIIIVQCLTYPIFIIYFGWILGLIYLGILVVLVAYNFPGKGFRSIPFLDLIAQFGYLLVIPFSIIVNGTEQIHWITYGYLLLFAIQSQLMGEVMDIDPDRQAGRQTTATLLGRINTKILIIIIVLAEMLLIMLVYQDYIFGGMFAFAIIWLLLDLLVIFKNKAYTLNEMKLFGVGSNAIALASMIYVWWSGCLLEVGV
ncbi:MAG: UbiA family prenyltransferase [Bacteroidota bacterium]